ncbi:MAG: CoA transferase, partial [Acidimicrobiales bacterium]
RQPGTAGMIEGVRYQVYETKDGKFVLFMASEQAFWRNFCQALGRAELFERWPGSRFADHARGNRELQAELRDIFKSKTSDEWIAFGTDADVPVAPVNSPRSIADDPQFRDRFQWFTVEQLGAEQLPTPLKFVGERLPAPTRAPAVGEHTEEILGDLLGWDAETIEAFMRRSVEGTGTDNSSRPAG